jgi:hypothetical protein
MEHLSVTPATPRSYFATSPFRLGPDGEVIPIADARDNREEATMTPTTRKTGHDQTPTPAAAARAST